MEPSDDKSKPDIEDMEERRDIEGLISALNHQEYIIRKEASAALKRVGDERAVDALIQALEYEEGVDSHVLLRTVREYSAEALGNIKDERAVEPLIQALNDEDEDVRWKSAWALGKIEDERAVEPLIQALNDETWIVRRYSAASLGKIGDERAVEFLIQAMNDVDWHVRKYAAASLGKIGDNRAIKPLVRALSDEDKDVRWRAIIALGKMGDAAVKPLIKAFKSEDYRIRGRAAEALGTIGNKRALKPLIAALIDKNKKDNNKYVRGRVAEALGNIKDERAIEPLIKALDEEYIYVRLKAEEALEKIESSSWVYHHDDGEVSFNYPISWKIIEIIDEKKILKGNSRNNDISFSLNRNTDAADITFEDISNIFKDFFLTQKSQIIDEIVLEIDGRDAYKIIGENLQLEPSTKIMIVAFTKGMILYYLVFSGNSEAFDHAQTDMDIILNSFHVKEF